MSFESYERTLISAACPVIAVTASTMIGDRERTIAAGFDSYVAKPIDLAQVWGKVTLLSSRYVDCE